MATGQVVQKQPFVIAEKGGKVAWCACGRSQNQPYCDGSHRGSEFRPVIVEVQAGQRVAWCGCKQTGNRPFCDGSHARL